LTATGLLIVTGKGGVGKSAVAAAQAIIGHRQGKRVLAIDMAASGGLASHLSVGPLGFRQQEIRPGLAALSVDRSQALIEYLQTQVGVPNLAPFGILARAFDALASTAPGIREVITIGKVLWEVRRRAWDLVVADAPPLGQIGSFLRAPRTVGELVPAGRIREQSDWMERLLTDPAETGLLLVTVPEELPTLETEEAMQSLASEGLPPPVVVANRVLKPLATTATGSGVAAEAALLHRSIYSEQREWLRRLPVDRTLPFLFGMLTPSEVALRLAESFA
jgi:anion-transporting  ArsA/GET3 family ATPase